MSYTLLMRKEASCIHPGNENIQNCLMGTCPALGASCRGGIQSIIITWTPACIDHVLIRQDWQWAAEAAERAADISSGMSALLWPHGAPLRMRVMLMYLFTGCRQFSSRGTWENGSGGEHFCDFFNSCKLVVQLLCEAIKHALNTESPWKHQGNGPNTIFEWINTDDFWWLSSFLLLDAASCFPPDQDLALRLLRNPRKSKMNGPISSWQQPVLY